VKTSLRITFIFLLLHAWRLSASVFYVSASSQNPTPPYSTWATAATNIQNAIDLGSSIDLVLVTNGVYRGGLLVTNGLIMESVNGPLFTTIDGGGTNRCLTISNRTWMQGFTLTNGWTATDGGAIWSTSGTSFITNCIIRGNCASNGGGAFQAYLFNCVLTGNCASNGAGGGAYFCGLYNCTVAGNLAANGGGAFNGSLYNSILYYNSATNGSNYAQVLDMANCCTTPDPGIGAGNITSAPLFVDYAAGNLRLQSTSPCIDAGNNVPHSQLDLDGNVRIYGNAIDIGAYEFNAQLYGPPSVKVQPLTQTVVTGSNANFQVVAFGEPPMSWQWWFNKAIIPDANNSSLILSSVTTNQAGNYFVVVTNSLDAVTSQVAVLTVLSGVPPSITLQPVSQTVSAGSIVSFTATATGIPPLSWQWLFNGNPIQDATNSSLTLTAVTGGQSGAYSVTVTNLAGTTVSTNATLIVQVSGTKYVWQNSPAPKAPYSTWETAAHTIQDAVDASVTNDSVLVTNGMYVGGVTVSRPLSLQSVNGPQVTLIDGGTTGQFTGSPCVYMASDASVSGFTLTNGLREFGGGAFGYYGHTYILTNCIITGNRAYLAGGGAAWCTLYNCTLTENWGETNGGAAVNSTLYNCTLVSNTGNSNYSTGAAVYGCTLYNCEVASNSFAATDTCTLYNCTVTGNQRGGALSSTLYNCIAYYNKPSPWAPSFPNYSGAVNYCCTTPMPTSGVGNITNEPLFVDPANGDFHLQRGSPCINAGSNSYAFGSDLDGNPRIIDGTVDIGAYESPHVGVMRYVWQQSPAPTPPYTNWTTAAHSIQDAVDAAATGDTILVTNGIYASGWRGANDFMPSRVVIKAGLNVASVNGPAVTEIDGGVEVTGGATYSIRCVYVGTNSMLGGFTLANGHTWDSNLTGNGGGAWCETSGALSNCVLSANWAAGGGGGVYGGILNDCTLVSNSAYYAGGAYGATLNRCILIGNSATNQSGGGAYGGTLNNCILMRNSAAQGGGVYSATLNNCVLTGNSAAQGGGVYAEIEGMFSGPISGPSVNNCTLVGNLADEGGGAYGCTLNNCIVYYNRASNGPNYFGSTVAYTCTTPLPFGSGNFETEPLLASSMYLSLQSPCIGRGSPTFASGVDIDGDPWQNPPCVGADQFVSGQNTGPLAVGIRAIYTNVSVGFAAAFEAVIDGRLSASVWDFGDGVVVSNRPFASHAWGAPGVYTVRLACFSDSYPNGVSATVAVQVKARDVYYVDVANANPAPPFTNWTTAAANIQAAIDAGSQVGRLVLVADGVYTNGSREAYGWGTNRVVVTEGVELRSVNGPAVTVIAGSAAGDPNYGWNLRCAYVGSNAILSGFTLTNGASSLNGGGGAWCERSALVTNCYLLGNYAFDFSGGGGYGGTFDNCRFATNKAGSGGGAAYGSTLNDCFLIGNYADEGGGVASCTLNRCSLNRNYGNGDGGGAYGSVLNHCALTGNEASNYGGGGVWGGILNNCVLSSNSVYYLTARGGAAVNATLNNCTITGSSTTFDGPAVTGGTLNNCIIYFNPGANYGGCTLNYCCTMPMPTAGVGNITNAPLFVDYSGSNFRLQSSSPCINGGSNGFVSGITDLDGNPRIVSGTVDIGAYEFHGTGSAIFYAWLQQYDLPTDGSADYVDTDSDGMNNWQEWVCGTNPTNALSCLRLISAVPTSTNVTVTWQSVAGMNYFLERSTDLVTPFTLAASNIVGQAGTTSSADTNASGTRPFFYRVGVAHP
jgi:hypothetical protein